MAFASFISLHPLSPPLSSASLFPFPQTRNHLHFQFNNFHRIGVHLSPQNEEYPDAETPSESNTIQQTRKKKKKRSPRPSFYDQTLDRWSVRISSQRSKFPWQQQQQQEEQQSEEEEARLQSPPANDSRPTGKPFNSPIGNRAITPPWAHGAKPRKTHLGFEVEAQNPAEDVEFDGEGVRNDRLDLIVEKLNGTRFNAGFPSVTSLGVRPVVPSWDHGAKPRDETPRPRKNVNFDRGDGNYGAMLADEKPDEPLEQKRSSSTLHFSGKSDVEDRHSSSKKTLCPTTVTFGVPFRNGVIEPMICHSDSEVRTRIPLEGHESNHASEGSMVGLVVEKLESPTDQDRSDVDTGISFGSLVEEHVLNSNLESSSVSLPWERNSGVRNGEGNYIRGNTEIAERTIPEPELRKLRNVSLRMKERMKVGLAGITSAVVESIHEKWKETEVVKIKFEGPLSLNMKRTHDTLERKTGGLVIWRAGSSLVLYRGLTYTLPCVQSYARLAEAGSSCNEIESSNDSIRDIIGENTDYLVSNSRSDENSTSSVRYPSEGCNFTSDIDSLLDQLGPRFKDWSGRYPLPVDADLLPGVVPGYKPPFRLLPYKTRSSLRNREMTSLRRLARTVPPHFALGRNRQHQGLAYAMVKLWEKSAIAKIAIKRGVQNTCNDRMAEEIKKMTGGVLLSRNKEFIVFYRGNDYLTPSIRDVLVEKQMLATINQDEEEVARLAASASIMSNAKTSKGPLVAGTLAETKEANTRWGSQASNGDREKRRRESALAKHASLVRNQERKLALAKSKVRKAEKALAKVQEFLNPAELPTDLETVTDEERSLFRRIGLKMRAFLLLGRREVFDGTIQNMHLNWKHRELVKIFVKGKNFAQVKHVAISLEAESGGVLISLDKTTKGYAIIIYRGKNYHRPQILRPRNLLTRRQALARSIELQRREALNHHISNLRGRIRMLRSELDQMESNEEMGNKDSHVVYVSDDEVEDEGEEAYLETYVSSDDDNDMYSKQ